MMRFLITACLCMSLPFLSGAQQAAGSSFGNAQQTGVLQDKQLTEASGIAASRLETDAYWLHNDSGDEARLFLMKKDGSALGIARFNEKVWDCEDIASGIGYKNGAYVYLGDIGDNLRIRSTIYVYIFKEKDLLQAVKKGNKVKDYYKVALHYPDGAHDAEALMIDPVDSLLYIVTKREANVGVYCVRLQEMFTRSDNQLQWKTWIPHTRITAGDIAASGNEILLKNYDSVFYWKRPAGEPVFKTLRRSPVLVPYQREKQGEAICFTAGNTGFITTSEGKHQPVYFYKRLK